MKEWIEAMRLRTLPVSVAGVFAAWAYALLAGCFEPAPALLSLAFAVLAQIASNFANEYYDYRDGLDRPGREGPRRGVTEGDISPRAMKWAAVGTLAAACAAGCLLIYWGGWWLLPAGILIAIGAFAYSAGPYPLSRHGLGEAAVLVFFGIAPVNLCFYAQAANACSWAAWMPCACFDPSVAAGSIAIGLMGANVLIVNNYRDAYEDMAVGKHTLAVILGRPAMAVMYLLNGYAAVALMSPTWLVLRPIWLTAPALYLALHTMLWARIQRSNGRALNPCLGATAMLMLAYTLGLLAASLCR